MDVFYHGGGGGGGGKSFCANFFYLSSNSCGNLLPFASTQTPNTAPQCITSTTLRSRWEHGPTTRPSRRHRQHHHTHRRHLSNYRSCPPWCNRPPSISCIIHYITGISVSSTNSAPIVIFTGMTLTLVLWPWLTFRSDLWFILWPLWGVFFGVFWSYCWVFVCFLPGQINASDDGNLAQAMIDPSAFKCMPNWWEIDHLRAVHR